MGNKLTLQAKLKELNLALDGLKNKSTLFPYNEFAKITYFLKESKRISETINLLPDQDNLLLQSTYNELNKLLLFLINIVNFIKKSAENDNWEPRHNIAIFENEIQKNVADLSKVNDKKLNELEKEFKYFLSNKEAYNDVCKEIHNNFNQEWLKNTGDNKEKEDKEEKEDKDDLERMLRRSKSADQSALKSSNKNTEQYFDQSADKNSAQSSTPLYRDYLANYRTKKEAILTRVSQLQNALINLVNNQSDQIEIYREEKKLIHLIMQENNKENDHKLFAKFTNLDVNMDKKITDLYKEEDTVHAVKEANAALQEESEVLNRKLAKIELLYTTTVRRNALAHNYNNLNQHLQDIISVDEKADDPGDLPYEDVSESYAFPCLSALAANKPIKLTDIENEIKRCEQDILTLEENSAELQKEIALLKPKKEAQAKAEEKLAQARHRFSGSYFAEVSKRHKNYLDQTMRSRLQYTISKFIDKKEETLTQIESSVLPAFQKHYQNKKNDLNAAINKQPSKLRGATLAALLGSAAGGSAYLASINPTNVIFDAINPVAGARTMLAGAFSGFVGMSVAKATYEIYCKSMTGKPRKSLTEFREIMEENGFIDPKYQALPDGFVQLFHYRDCILQNLEDETGSKMRDEFIATLPEDQRNKKFIDAAIEVFFLAELNKLFNVAFDDIYTIHQDQINDEANQSPIIAFIRSCFSDPQKRKEFTQQMQIKFMEQTIQFLHTKTKASTFVRYPLLSASISGLMAGFLVLSTAVFLGTPIGLGIASIALVVMSVFAVTTFLRSKRLAERTKDNRERLGKAIAIIRDEKTRLDLLVKQTETINDKKIKALKRHKDLNNGNWSLTNFFGSPQEKMVALGGSLSWLRYFSQHYRHSKQVEIDFKQPLEQIVEKSKEQTELLQAILVKMMTKPPAYVDPQLERFINETTAYLNDVKDEKNQQFIKEFDMKGKIKEQVLNMVLTLPSSLKESTSLPKILVNFYVDTLGGSISDLSHVRKLTQIFNQRSNHQATLIELIEQKRQESVEQGQFILGGISDTRCRQGLRPLSFAEEDIVQSNIDKWLQDSYAFLLSLADYSNTRFDEVYSHNEAYLTYKILFLQQLAMLSDVNRVKNDFNNDQQVRDTIADFMEKKLGITNCQKVLNEIKNQNYYHSSESANNEERFNDAVVVSIVYGGLPLTPKQLIKNEMEAYLLKNKKQVFLLQEKIQNNALFSMNLVPDKSTVYQRHLQETIAATEAFIHAMDQNDLLKKSYALESYVKGVIKDVDDLIEREMKKVKKHLLDENSPSLSVFRKQLEEVLKKNQSQVPNAMEHLFEEKRPDFGHALNNFIRDLIHYINNAGNLFFQDQVAMAINLVKDLRRLKKTNGGVYMPKEYQLNNLAPSDLKELIQKHLDTLNCENLADLFQKETEYYQNTY